MFLLLVNPIAPICDQHGHMGSSGPNRHGFFDEDLVGNIRTIGPWVYCEDNQDTQMWAILAMAWGFPCWGT